MNIVTPENVQTTDLTALPGPVSASLELITPEIADSILENRVDNRTPNDKRIREYADRMLSGEWRISDPIKFDNDGKLYDGQHRLMAVVKAGVPVEFAVIRNMPKNAKFYCDIGQSRTTLHIANIMGVHIASKKISSVKEIIRTQHHLYRGGISHHFAIRMYLKYQDGIDFACKNRSGNTEGIKFENAVFFAAIAKAYYYENHLTLERFAQVLFTGLAQSEEEHSAVTLRNIYLQARQKDNKMGSSERTVWMFRTINAIQNFVRKKSIKRISPAPQDFYPVPDACDKDNVYSQKRLRYFNDNLLNYKIPATQIVLPE